MTPCTKNPGYRRTIFLFVLLGIVAAGFQQVEFHSHADAHPGHVHDLVGGVSAVNVDVGETDEDGVMHTHDISAPTLTPTPVLALQLVANRPTESRIPPPTASPPNGLKTPLYRPPIV